MAMQAPIFVDGLYIQYKTAGTSGLGAASFVNVALRGNATNASRPHTYRNITLDVNGNYFTGSGAYKGGLTNLPGSYVGVYGSGTNRTSVSVENLTLLNVVAPKVATPHCLLYITKATARNITVYGIGSSTTVAQFQTAPVMLDTADVWGLSWASITQIAPSNNTLGFIEMTNSTLNSAVLSSNTLSSTPVAYIHLKDNSSLLNSAVTLTVNTYPALHLSGAACLVANNRIQVSIGTVPESYTYMSSTAAASHTRFLGNYVRIPAGTFAPVGSLQGTDSIATQNIVHNTISGGLSPVFSMATGGLADGNILTHA
jgi:hypothetical protein